jgi:hypothetical protein
MYDLPFIPIVYDNLARVYSRLRPEVTDDETIFQVGEFFSCKIYKSESVFPLNYIFTPGIKLSDTQSRLLLFPSRTQYVRNSCSSGRSRCGT